MAVVEQPIKESGFIHFVEAVGFMLPSCAWSIVDAGAVAAPAHRRCRRALRRDQEDHPL